MQLSKALKEMSKKMILILSVCDEEGDVKGVSGMLICYMQIPFLNPY